MFDEMAPYLTVTFGNLESAKRNSDRSKIHVLFPPHRDPSLFHFRFISPYPCTMGDDDTQQQHEHPLSCVTDQAIHTSYTYQQSIQSVTQ
jgi:hypothetical protein